MCKCLNKPETFFKSAKNVIKSSIRFILIPRSDNFSATSFAIGRFLGSIFGKVYVPVLGDHEHLEKIREDVFIKGCPFGKCKRI